MKKLVLLWMFTFIFSMTVGSDIHPKIAELQSLAEKNPIGPRIPEILESISEESMELNKLGYQAYTKKQYNEALEYFKKAIQADTKNSFAYYNAACMAVLSGSAYYSYIDWIKFAVSLDWYWGLRLLVDPDLDSVRSTDLSLLDEYSYKSSQQNFYITGRGDVNNGDFLEHIFHEDGTVSLINASSRENEEIARGYFCFFIEDTPHGSLMRSGSLFEYFPKIEEYRLWYPNSHEDMPARENAVFYPEFSQP